MVKMLLLNASKKLRAANVALFVAVILAASISIRFACMIRSSMAFITSTMRALGFSSDMRGR